MVQMSMKKDEYGRTALHIYVDENSKEIIGILLSHGAIDVYSIRF